MKLYKEDLFQGQLAVATTKSLSLKQILLGQEVLTSRPIIHHWLMWETLSLTEPAKSGCKTDWAAWIHDVLMVHLIHAAICN